MSDDLKLRKATDVVGSLNSQGPLVESPKQPTSPAPDVETPSLDETRRMLLKWISGFTPNNLAAERQNKLTAERLLDAVQEAAEARGRNETQHELTELYDTEVVRRRTLETSLTEQAETIRQLREDVAQWQEIAKAHGDDAHQLAADLVTAEAQSPAAVRATLEGLKTDISVRHRHRLLDDM